MFRKALVFIGLIVLALSFLLAAPADGQTIPLGDIYLPLIRSNATPGLATATPTRRPTFTATSTATPSPTATVERTATPTLAPNTVIVLNSLAYKPFASSDAVFVVGEVKNNTIGNVASVNVNVVLRNESGAIVDGRSDGASIRTLTPGMTSPFVVFLFDAPAEWSTYHLTITYSNSDHGPSILETSDLETYFDGSGDFHVQGHIKNQFDSSKFVSIVTTLYDASNHVIGAATTLPNPSLLQPGQQVFFDSAMSFWAGSPEQSQIDHYSVVVYDNF